MANSPVELTKKHPSPFQPNAHPYAIKTTSSALLSRSSSSPHYTNHTTHHYIPVPPSRVTGRTRPGHRHSSSLSVVEDEMGDRVRGIPAPLPTPPSTVATLPDNPTESLSRVDEPRLTHKVGGSETIPSSPTNPVTEHYTQCGPKYKYHHAQDSGPTLIAGLPLNPRKWTTNELTTYLGMSLGSPDNKIDTPNEDTTLVPDILDYVRTRGLSGRELLRLTEGDLVGSPLSDTGCVKLLECSRTLRADILRGRIYVDSYHSHDVSEHSNDIYSLSTRGASVRGTSVSVDDLRLPTDNNIGEGTVALPPSPAMTLHRSNSVSDASAQRYRDLARMRMRRRGRVKGLVETWERASTSGSECSASEEESVAESDADGEAESVPDPNCSPGRSFELSSHSQAMSPHDVRSAVAHSTDIAQEPSSLTPPPPYTHVCITHSMDEEVEPTIEELLASSSNIPLKGARAWEADFGLGDTIKRVPVCLIADTENSRSLTTEFDTPRGLKDGGQQTGRDHARSKRSSARGSAGSRSKNSKTQSRVVTAIFTGSPAEGVRESIGDEVHLADHCSSGANDSVCSEVSMGLNPQHDAGNVIRALEESITATRAEIDAFRVRLEHVEADIAEQEVELRRAQYSHALYNSEAKQRRLEASVQTTMWAPGLSKDGILVANAKDKDALEIWETISLSDVAHAIVARAVGWLFPSGRLGFRRSRVRSGSCSGINDSSPFLAKGRAPSSLARMSCSIILVSFAICAAVLRRMGFGRWARRP